MNTQKTKVITSIVHDNKTGIQLSVESRDIQIISDVERHENSEFEKTEFLIRLKIRIANEYENANFDVCSFAKDNLQEFLKIHYEDVIKSETKRDI
jgi:hypothetical protein